MTLVGLAKIYSMKTSCPVSLAIDWLMARHRPQECVSQRCQKSASLEQLSSPELLWCRACQLAIPTSLSQVMSLILNYPLRGSLRLPQEGIGNTG